MSRFEADENSDYFNLQDERLRKTVLALFGEEKEVNKVTGRLKVMDR